MNIKRKIGTQFSRSYGVNLQSTHRYILDKARPVASFNSFVTNEQEIDSILFDIDRCRQPPISDDVGDFRRIAGTLVRGARESIVPYWGLAIGQ